MNVSAKFEVNPLSGLSRNERKHQGNGGQKPRNEYTDVYGETESIFAYDACCDAIQLLTVVDAFNTE